MICYFDMYGYNRIVVYFSLLYGLMERSNYLCLAMKVIDIQEEMVQDNAALARNMGCLSNSTTYTQCDPTGGFQEGGVYADSPLPLWGRQVVSNRRSAQGHVSNCFVVKQPERLNGYALEIHIRTSLEAMIRLIWQKTRTSSCYNWCY